MKRALPTLNEVLEQLRTEGLVTGEPAAALQVQAGASDQPVPWYVRAMVAMSAWIAALLIQGSLYGMRLVQSSGSMIIAGAVFCIVSVALQRNAKQVLFLSSLALAICFTGQAMLIAGLGSQFHSATAVAFLVMLLNVGFLIVYDDRTMRFLSTLAIIGAAFAIILDNHIPYGFQLMTLLLAGGSAAVWMSESRLAAGRLSPIYRPVGYGMVVGLFGALLPSIMPAYATPHIYAPDGSWISAGGMLLVLLYLEYQLLLEHALLSDRRIAATALIGTLALLHPSRRMPGMIAAIIVLLLGFQRGNRILMGFALTFLFVFITAYYYNLGMTLLQKSIALMLTGAVLLVMRSVLVRLLGQDGEVAHE